MLCGQVFDFGVKPYQAFSMQFAASSLGIQIGIELLTDAVILFLAHRLVGLHRIPLKTVITSSRLLLLHITPPLLAVAIMTNIGYLLRRGCLSCRWAEMYPCDAGCA